MRTISTNNNHLPTSKDPELGSGENPVNSPADTPQEESSTQEGSSSTSSRRVELILWNPIIRNIRNQEIGKMVFGISVTMITAFTIYFLYQKSTPMILTFVVVLLSIGSSAILNGLLLRDYYQLAATFMEVGGIAIVLLAVNGMVASFLPPGLRWIGGLIGVSTAAPFIIAAIKSPSNLSRVQDLI